MERFWRYVQANQKPTLWTWLGLIFGVAWIALIISELNSGINKPAQWAYLAGGICILCASGADCVPSALRWPVATLRLLASTLLVMAIAVWLVYSLLG